MSVPSGRNETSTNNKPANHTNPPFRPIDIQQQIHSPRGAFGRSTTSDFGRPFTPLQQHVFRDRHFHLRPENSFIRSGVVNHASYNEQGRTEWHSSVGGPGGAVTTTSSSTHTSESMDPAPWWVKALIITGSMIWLTMMVYHVWSWLMGWFTNASGQPTSMCWNIGIPIGPVYIGYGCQGWILDVTIWSYHKTA